MSRPDEGMIHAWLDGELDAAEAARIEALVRDDAEWAAAAAEARGFIAASARIVGALDHVPANVIPNANDAREASQPVFHPATERAVSRAGESARARRAPWWVMRVAALIVVATGTALIVARSPGNLEQATAPQMKDDGPPAMTAAGPTAATVAPAAPLTAIARPAPAAANAPPLAEGAGIGTSAASTKGASEPVAASAAASGEAAKMLMVEPSRRDRAEDLRAGATPVPQECYREAPAATGGQSTVHRVGRTGDTTALTSVALGTRVPVSAFSAAAAGAASLTVRGDTLFLGVANGVARTALRITCPAP